MPLKVFLTGRVGLETEGVAIDEARFPGRQGRLVFAYLVAEKGKPVPRRELEDVRARAVSVLAAASLRSGDAAEAVKWAEQAIALSPFRETGYRQLMEAHAAAGNRAEALRVYERCRRLLAEELGAFPSPETEAIYRALLEAPSAPAVATPAEPSAAALFGDERAGPTRRRRRLWIGLGVEPISIAAAGRYVWVLGPNALLEFDGRTHTRVRTVPLAGTIHVGRFKGEPLRLLTKPSGRQFNLAAGVGAGGGALWSAGWYADGEPLETISRIDARTLTITDVPPANIGAGRNGIYGLAGGANGVWGINAADKRVWKI